MELQAEITKIRDDTQKKVELVTNALHKYRTNFSVIVIYKQARTMVVRRNNVCYSPLIKSKDV